MEGPFQSPIPDKFWKYMFHVSAAYVGVRVMWSLYKQSSQSYAPTLAPFKAMNQAKTSEEVVGALVELQKILDDAERNSQTLPKLVIQNNLAPIIKRMKYVPGGNENDREVFICLRIVRGACDDAESRDKFFACNGVNKLLNVLQAAHKDGNAKIMEEAAIALGELTTVEEHDVILPSDQPEGSRGAAGLIRFRSTLSMLRTLSPTGRVAFLTGTSCVFANICALRVGARIVAQGFDGSSGASFFIALLSHGNAGIVANAVRSLRSLVMHAADVRVRDAFVHEEVAAAAEDIGSIIEMYREATTLHHLLYIVRHMSKSKSRDAFLEKFAAGDGLTNVFKVWIHYDNEGVRDHAEILVRVLEQTKISGRVRELLDKFRPSIQERKQKDQEAKRKKMQQQRQQQMMMQQMMMAEMGGGDPSGMMGGDDM